MTDAVCASGMVAANPTPLELYVMLDSSLSMNDATAAGPTKWAAVSSALSTFFSDQASAGISVAIKYFPSVQTGAPATCTTDGGCGSFGPCDRRKTCVASAASTIQISPLCLDASSCGTMTCSLIKSCGGSNYCAAGPTAPANSCAGCTDLPGYCHGRDSCAAATYATPDVALTTLPSNALAGALAAHSPAGYTPTGPAIAGALAFARQRIASKPAGRIAVLLVTDGLPGGFIPGFPPAECSPSDISGIAAVLAGPQGRAGTPPVSTFVLGVLAPGPELATAQSNLDMLATGGGTAPAFVVDTGQNVSPPLLTALERVRSKATACTYAIPTGAPDLDRLNVQLTTGAGVSTFIGRVAARAACTSAGGWSYDVDPRAGTPTTIDLCPATCQQVQADVGAHVDIVLGCPTITTP